MPILVSESTPHTRELIPSGMYIARCYQLIQIGEYKEFSTYLNKTITENKVRITWELPTHTKEFKEGEGEKPFSISKEFTLSLNEKGNLRPFLNSWRGKSFTDDESNLFDIEKLLGVPCMLNIIHKKSKDGTKTFDEIAKITPVVKGIEVPIQVNKSLSINYGDFDWIEFEKLPDFIKDKMKKSDQFKQMTHPSYIDSFESIVNAEGTDNILF